MADRREWTFPELRRARARVEAGETWDQIAADFGVHSSTLRKQVYKYIGCPDLTKRPKTMMREKLILEAIALRNNERLSYGIIKERIGWPRQVVTLRQSVMRYAELHDLEVFAGFPKTRKNRWDNHE